MVDSASEMPDTEPKLHSVMESVVEPLIRGDGGELYVVEVSERAVELHLRGRFAGCPGNSLAIRKVIEPALKAVAPACRIHISSGELLPNAALTWEEHRRHRENG